MWSVVGAGIGIEHGDRMRIAAIRVAQQYNTTRTLIWYNCGSLWNLAID